MHQHQVLYTSHKMNDMYRKISIKSGFVNQHEEQGCTTKTFYAQYGTCKGRGDIDVIHSETGRDEALERKGENKEGDGCVRVATTEADQDEKECRK